MASKKFSFIDWINELGTPKIAEELGVQVSTVRHWRLGVCYPRVDQMREIRKLSKNRVSYEMIIDGTKK